MEQEKEKLGLVLSEPNLFNEDKEKFIKSINRFKLLEEELLKLYSIWN
ncbi:hypothetical protein HC766_01385 [Candidatus Gracilibacteria bacterium]|nr:hypothetical protein [Candidatus Gracilibacteria bacterium]